MILQTTRGGNNEEVDNKDLTGENEFLGLGDTEQ
jgi:hypothetical protein